jgi:[acyl-carrier-protein] S-malonyltransferase
MSNSSFNKKKKSAPFHCGLMKEAADVMEDALKSVKIQMPCVDVISNVTAKPVSIFICS